MWVEAPWEPGVNRRVLVAGQSGWHSSAPDPWGVCTHPQVFDNTDYESRLHAEWVPSRPGLPPTPAHAAVPAGPGQPSVWMPCTVVSYDAEGNLYCVVVDPAAAAAHPGVAAAAEDSTGSVGGAAANGHTTNGAQQAGDGGRWVPRVTLHFSAEDPFLFAKRYAEAHSSRARAESLLRYNLYVDSMPTEDIPPLTTEQVGPHGV